MFTVIVDDPPDVDTYTALTHRNDIFGIRIIADAPAVIEVVALGMSVQ